ncbi:MAG: hypothetical protein ACE5KG_02325 [Nitrososphaerales archaeon]
MQARNVTFEVDDLGDLIALWIGYEDISHESYEKEWKGEIIGKISVGLASGVMKHSFGTSFYSFVPQGKDAPEALGLILPKFLMQAIVNFVSGKIS